MNVFFSLFCYENVSTNVTENNILVIFYYFASFVTLFKRDV